MKTIAVLFVATLIGFCNLSYGAGLSLPAHITYQTSKVEFWCQKEDIEDGDCSVVSVSPDMDLVAVTGTAGFACGDTPVGVINLTTGKAMDIDYDGGCHTNATAQFYKESDGKVNLHLIDKDTGKVIRDYK